MKGVELRFGLDEVQPGQELTNAERLAAEVVDLLAVLGMLEDSGVELHAPARLVADKVDKVNSFLEYSAKLGRVEID